MTLAIQGGNPEVNIDAPHFRWPRVTEQIRRAVIEQLDEGISIYDRSGIFLRFEEEFRSNVGKTYALLTNSGTSALHSIYEGIDIRQGDEVLVPAYTFFATISPLMQYGARIIQVDADYNGNIDPSLIEKYITPKTRAIVATHMWGHPCQVDKLQAISSKHGLSFVEDCSHAHGAIYKGAPVGKVSTAAAWSLQGQKLITGGEGGILLTDERRLYERAVLHGHYNKRAKQDLEAESPLMPFATTGFGLKLRAHPLAVAIAYVHLSNMKELRETRLEHAKILCDAVREFEFIKLPEVANSIPAWYAFVFRYDPDIAGISMEIFIRALKEEGLFEVDRPNSTGCTANYPLFTETEAAIPRLYNQPALVNANEPQPHAETFFRRAVKLPVWGYLDERHIVQAYARGLNKVCGAIQGKQIS